MGLLSRIEAEKSKNFSAQKTISEESPLITENISDKGLSFFEFIKKHNLSHCAVLTKSGSKYSMHFSAGFDRDTILESISSSDFWDGTIGDDQWFFYSAENNSINQMLQLFSEKFRKTIGFAQVYRHEEKILLIAENQNFESNYSLSELSDDFINLDFAEENSLSIGNIDNQYKLKLKINCEEALTKALSTFIYPEVIIENIKSAFLTEFQFQIASIIEIPNSFKTISLNTAIIGIQSSHKLSEKALKSFITLNLSLVFGSEASLINYDL